MKEQAPLCWAHYQITSMYVSFIVEKEKEKSNTEQNLCSVHSVILEKHIILCLNFSTEKVLEGQDTIPQKAKFAWSHCIGKSKDKVTATLIRICL